MSRSSATPPPRRLPSSRLLLAPLLLALALGTAACGTLARGATPTSDPARGFTQQGGYIVTLALLPWSELGSTPPSGALPNLGFVIEVAGPVAVQIDVEYRILRERGMAWAVGTFDRVAFRREPGQREDTPLGRLVGGIVLPAGVQPGDEMILLATVETSTGYLEHAPHAFLQLRAGGDGALLGVPAPFTLGLRPDETPPARAVPTPAIAPTVRPPMSPAQPPRPIQPVDPTPTWPRRATPLTGPEAIARAAVLLRPAVYARARVEVTPDAGDRWRVRLGRLGIGADALRLPPDPAVGGLPLATVALDRIELWIDAATGQTLRIEAFADPAGAPERAQPRIDSALPAGMVAILLPAGSQARTRTVYTPTEYIRPIGEEELRAAGFVVVHDAAGLERAVAAGARVLWVHPDGVPLIGAAWLRARYDDGMMIGLLEGTLADFDPLLALPQNSTGTIPPGTWRPTLAYIHRHRCPNGTTSGGAGAEWLSLHWLLAISRITLQGPCHP